MNHSSGARPARPGEPPGGEPPAPGGEAPAGGPPTGEQGGDGPGPLGAADVLAPRLSQFAVVAREEHVSRAAELLGIPQPTLSRSIARLEADLGVPLFTRTGRGVRLTRHGRTLLAGAERALAELETRARLLAAEASPQRGKVAFGFLHTLGSQVVPGMLREFRATHPGIRFALVQGSSASLLAALRAGEADLCLVSPMPDGPGVAARALSEQRIDLVVPAGHRFAGRTAIRLAEAAGEDFACLESGYGLRGITDGLCAAAGFTPRITFEGEEVDTVRGLVAAGLGVALLPATGSRARDVVRVRISEPRASRTIGLAWLAGQPAAPPVAAFRDFALGYPGRLFAG